MTTISSAARAAATLLAAALVGTAITLAGAPAYAADVALDGIAYAEIDPADPSAGAAVTAYDATANPDHPAVVIPDEVEIDGDMHAVVEVTPRVFDGAGLESVTLPAGLVLIDEWAFANNSLTEIALPASLERIYGQAFQANALRSVNLPSSVTVVGRAAFYDNELTSATLSPSMTALAPVTFGENALTRVWVPASITEIGNDVFTGNPDLRRVTFGGPEMTYTGPDGSTPIAPPGSGTNPEIHFYYRHLDAYSWPTWHGFTSVPLADVRFADLHLGVDVYPHGIDARLDQGTDAPYGVLGSHLDEEFDLTAPEGYLLAGWAANGEPWEVGDPIYEDTLLTPLWLNTTQVRSVVVTPSATEVEEGESVTLTAEGFNILGDSVGDVTADMEFQSDVATDEVSGATVTFPTASPHTITGLYLPLEIWAAPVVVEVLPAQIDEETEPEPEVTPVPEDEPAPDPTPIADVIPNEDFPEITAPAPQLAATGIEDQRTVIAAAAAMMLAGMALVVVRRRAV